MRNSGALGGRYRLNHRLGAGSTSEVWLAHDVATGGAVAAKLLRPALATDPVVAGRFVHEQAVLLGLDHPHIVHVHGLVVDGENLAIVMDLVRGDNLRRRLAAAGRFAPYDAATVVSDVLSALAAAHDRGVVHRDVKPDNVLVEDGDPPVVKLSDFGIAHCAQEATTRMTGLLGTPDYLAPEVLIAEVVTPAADVYGAGLLLYELLAGRTPFAGADDAQAVAHRQVTAIAPPLAVPAALSELLDAMLAKDPASRPTAQIAMHQLRAMLPRLAGLARLPPSTLPASWATVPDAPGSAMEPTERFAVLGYVPGDRLVDPRRTVVRGSPARYGPTYA